MAALKTVRGMYALFGIAVFKLSGNIVPLVFRNACSIHAVFPTPLKFIAF
jgi:hypothetical protein